MSRPRAHQLASVKRMLLRLSLLDGRLLSTREGLRLVRVRAVKDAAALVQAASEPEGLSPSSLARHLELEGTAVEPTERWLGAAQRDLRILAQAPALLRFIAESHRALGRFGRIDGAWLADRQSRLDALGAEVALRRQGADVAPQPRRLASLEAASSLVAALRGEAAADHLALWRARSLEYGRRARETARRRLACLKARLQGGQARCDVPDDVLGEAEAELNKARDRPGRPGDRRTRRVVRALLAWPEPRAHSAPESASESASESPLPGDLLAAVREVGEQAISSMPSSRDPASLARLERALTLLGLTCRTEEEGALSPSDVALVLRAFAKHGGPAWPGPPVRSYVALLRLALEAPLVPIATTLVAQGLDVATIGRLASHGKLEGLYELHEDLPAVRAWSQWTLEVAVPLAAQGVEVTLPPALFAGEGPHPELRAFAQVLIANHARSTPIATLAALDAMVALLKSAPEALHGFREELLGTTPGLGRAALPAFAAWLGDDEALDRFCHVKRLAGEPLTLSRALGRDFLQFERLTQERAHLLALSGKSDAQRLRLERLAGRLASAEAPDTSWTRRRLTERTEALLARALERRLDSALREVLRRLWGIQLGPAGRPTALTPAWRDAVRFLLSTTDNRELLGVLLRHAARRPGAAIVAELTPNRRWLEEARAHLDVDAWLKPRSVGLELAGRRYTLATEEDPLEALRMGIPFGTCLSLAGGVNAAAAVLNAMDANKRVLYLRAADGAIVARKLLAISGQWQLLGYRLYVALEHELRPAVADAVDAFCLELAQASRLPFATSGKPATIHRGFWYDDGAVPFAEQGDPLAARFCASLGQPSVNGPAVRQEARAWDAHARGDVEAALDAVDRWGHGASTRALAFWVVDRLGEPAAVGRVASHPGLAEALLERAMDRGPEHLLPMYQRLGHGDWRVWRLVSGLLDRAPPTARLARQLVDTSRALCGKAARFDDHDVEHGTMYLLPQLLEAVPVADALALLERIEPVWGYVVEQSPSCAECLDWARHQAAQACVEAYARSPQPQAVVSALLDPRGRATTQAALAIAARFSFPRGRREVPPRVSRLAKGPALLVGCPTALRALRALRDRQRALSEEPLLLAAMLRQSGALAPVTLEELPRPSAPPFEALGDLQVLLPELSAAVLAPYDDVPADAPGPWALSFHRRRSTRWRRALLAAAPEDRAARTWLAVLGEAGAVSSALKRGPRQARARRGRQVRGPTPPAIPEHELVPLARQVALEVAGQTDAMSGRAVDVWAVERRLAALDQATREGDSVGAIEACRSLGTSAPPTAADWRAITEELLERGVPDEVLAEVSARWAPTCGSVSAELVVRLLPFPLCRRVFVARLASLEPDWLVGWYCRLVAAAAALGNVELEPFLDEWLRAWLLRAQADLGDEALYAFDGLKERLLSLAWGDVSTAVGVFQWVPEAAVAARMIPELVSRFGPSALRAALATQSQEGPDVADRHRWLLAAIDGPS